MSNRSDRWLAAAFAIIVVAEVLLRRDLSGRVLPLLFVVAFAIEDEARRTLAAPRRAEDA